MIIRDDSDENDDDPFGPAPGSPGFDDIERDDFDNCDPIFEMKLKQKLKLHGNIYTDL